MLCIVAIVPTTVDPSCIGYFVYSNHGLASVISDAGGDDHDRGVDSSERPSEGLAATRLPDGASVEPHVVLEPIVRPSMRAPSDMSARHVEPAPDFLARSHRSTFLRNAVLLI